MPEFQSKIIRVIVDIKDPIHTEVSSGLDDSSQEKEFLQKVRMAWKFFKERCPDWIMVDLHGNPLEEVLRQKEEKKE